MCHIETYIFMDFETTGLFDDGQNNPLTNPNRCNETPRERSQRLDSLVKSDGNRFPKITEMAFVSVPRALFIEGVEKMSSRHLSSQGEDGGEGIKPVQIVANAHVRQLNPQLNEKERAKYEELQRKVPSMLLRISDLACKCAFAQEWPGVVHLLQTAPKPICLIAHNGVNFDFRILCHELIKSDSTRCHPIPEQVFLLDSFSCFYELDKEYSLGMELTMENIDWGLVLSQFQPPIAETVVQVEVENSFQQNSNGTASLEQQIANDQHQTTVVLHRLTVAQKTPTKTSADGASISSPSRTTAKRALFNSEVHPLKLMRKTHWSPAKHRCIDAKFFVSNGRGEWNFNGDHARRLLGGRGNFKLSNMFSRVFSVVPQFHRAQSDCEALLQVCLSYGMDFVKFADKNCSSLPDCFKAAS